MATYDFSTQLHHRTGEPFTTVSIGLGNMLGIWTEPTAYREPLRMGTVLELLLLYTVDRRALQRPAPNNVLNEEEKRNRYALAQKIRDNGIVELAPREVDLLKTVISVLGVEPNALCHEFLNSPQV